MREIMKEYFTVPGVKVRLGITGVLYVAEAILNAVLVIWLSNCISAVVARDTVTATQYGIVFIAGSASLIAVTGISDYTKKFAENLGYTVLHERLIERILFADNELFTRYSTGEVSNIANNYTFAIVRSGRLILRFITAGANIIAIVVSIAMIAPYFVMYVLPIYIISAVIIKNNWALINKADNIAEELASKRNAETTKIIDGFAEVRTNSTQQMHLSVFHKLNMGTFKAYTTKSKKIVVVNILFEGLADILAIVAVIYAYIAIPKGIITGTVAMSLVMYGYRISNPLAQLMDCMDEISSETAKFEHYKRFCKAAEPTIIDGAIELESFESSIKFNNVSFSYDKSDTILNKCSLSIQKGQSIGICGSSGGGKSTLLKLLIRSYDVTDGSITVDNIDIKDLTISSLRNKIGMVHQTNYIFDGTILENVAYGVSSADMVAVVDACKKANIYDFILSLKNGFDTKVGPGGLKLSGGQKQRIALARIFLRDPEIIILDEATAALDNEAEAIIQESLKLFKGKTMITVAHRLSTIMDSDKIFVINEHAVSESGTHEELIQKGGEYAKLWQLSQKK